MDILAELDAATAHYRATEHAHHTARTTALNAVLAALRAGAPPTQVAGRSPFTAAWVRQVARRNGIGPARPGRKKAASGA